MSCTNCGTGGCSSGGCRTGGCNRLNVFDWLSYMDGPSLPFNIVEIRFKSGRKEFFRNAAHLELHTGDPVVVSASSGNHLGFVSLQGELVRLQLKKKKVSEDSEEIREIIRLADEKDVEKFEQAKARELPCLFRTREIIRDLKLQMKLSEVEFQADNSKATFYYSAEDRVDFRELIKLLAAEFRVRIEMKQINLRQEAGMLGGIGVCGRELCCSTWLTSFKNVNTSAARYQNLSLNPAKLSGQCGRLKCCLNYELETYMDALTGIPKVEAPIKTAKGPIFLQKTDIFRKLMWFSFQEETTWKVLPVEEVKNLLEQNKKGITPDLGWEKEEPAPAREQSFTSGELHESERSRLDKKIQGAKKKKKKKKKGPPGGAPTQQPA